MTQCVSAAGSQVAGEDAETAVGGRGPRPGVHPPGGGGAGPGRQGGGHRLAAEEDQRQRAEWRSVVPVTRYLVTRYCNQTTLCQ